MMAYGSSYLAYMAFKDQSIENVDWHVILLFSLTHSSNLRDPSAGFFFFFWYQFLKFVVPVVHFFFFFFFFSFWRV